jgi:hypothetical protein
MNFRLKFTIAFFGFILFWFTIFYPVIIPYMNQHQFYPLIAVLIFESLFYVTTALLSFAILGENHSKHALKIAFVLFMMYHALDAIEPPFIVNSSGVFQMTETAIVSWDYGVAYFLQNTFNLTGPALYYITNFGIILVLIVASVIIISPASLGKIAKKIL